MEAMKKAVLLTICIMMGAISQLMAQPMNRGGLNTPGVQYLITEYGDELALTDEQKSQLIALQVQHRNEWRTERREMSQGRRGEFRRDRRDGRQGPRAQGFRNADPQFMQARAEARSEMRQEVLDILTDEQKNLLQTKMIEKAESAHEFRTFRHQHMVNEAGIQGNKAEEVLNLLNEQSNNRLELDKQRIQNPSEVNQELRGSFLQQMRDTDDQLRSLLTVDEYESLRKNMGIGNRPYRDARGPRRWSR
jgi:hypothetical protein